MFLSRLSIRQFRQPTMVLPATIQATPSNPTIKGHRPQLDALRALAVAGVLVAHTMENHPLVRFIDPGQLGVKLFFVLSGFLISRILFDTVEAGNLKPFYARRTLRIMPLYYVVLAFTVVAAGPSLNPSWGFHAAFLSNWWFFFTESWDPLTSHFWTLGVEEQFYLVWPILLAKTPRKYWRFAVAGLVACGFASRLFFDLTRPEGFGFAFPTYALDLFGIGAGLGLWLHTTDPPAARIRRVALTALVLGAGQLLLLSVWYGTARLVTSTVFGVIGIGLINVGIIGLAFVGMTGTISRVANWRPLVFLGQISYGIYAWHLLARFLVTELYAAVDRGNDLAPVGLFLSTSTVSVVLALASWYLFESRLLKLKARFPYRR